MPTSPYPHVNWEYPPPNAICTGVVRHKKPQKTMQKQKTLILRSWGEFLNLVQQILGQLLANCSANFSGEFVQRIFQPCFSRVSGSPKNARPKFTPKIAEVCFTPILWFWGRPTTMAYKPKIQHRSSHSNAIETDYIRGGRGLQALDFKMCGNCHQGFQRPLHGRWLMPVRQKSCGSLHSEEPLSSLAHRISTTPVAITTAVPRCQPWPLADVSGIFYWGKISSSFLLTQPYS